MRKSTKQLVLTKPSIRDLHGNRYIETITVRVKDAPVGTMEEAVAKTFQQTTLKVILDSISEAGCEILLTLNRISLLHDDLDREERLIVVSFLNNKISQVYERIFDVLLPESDHAEGYEKEDATVVDEVRGLVSNSQQITKEISDRIEYFIETSNNSEWHEGL